MSSSLPYDTLAQRLALSASVGTPDLVAERELLQVTGIALADLRAAAAVGGEEADALWLGALGHVAEALGAATAAAVAAGSPDGAITPAAYLAWLGTGGSQRFGRGATGIAFSEGWREGFRGGVAQACVRAAAPEIHAQQRMEAALVEQAREPLEAHLRLADVEREPLPVPVAEPLAHAIVMSHRAQLRQATAVCVRDALLLRVEQVTAQDPTMEADAALDQARKAARAASTPLEGEAAVAVRAEGWAVVGLEDVEAMAVRGRHRHLQVRRQASPSAARTAR